MRGAWIILAAVLAGLAMTLLTMRRPASTPADEWGVARETLAQARREKFNYVRVLEKASEGDLDALRRIIAFTAETDGPGLHGQRIVLQRLYARVGRAKFEEALAEMPPDKQPYGTWLLTDSPAPLP